MAFTIERNVKTEVCVLSTSVSVISITSSWEVISVPSLSSVQVISGGGIAKTVHVTDTWSVWLTVSAVGLIDSDGGSERDRKR